ncbi:MAG: hypothetical protein M1549_00910 [Candidatus Dependentiae bacterium]|nr:hypothetical protein [Candidatus Dependentiae bacterium]
MKKSIHTLIILLLASLGTELSDAGNTSSITQYANTEAIMTLGVEFPRFLKDNHARMLAIWADYTELGYAFYTYLRGNPPTVSGLSQRLAGILSAIAGNENSNQLLSFVIQIDHRTLSGFVRLGGGQIIEAAVGHQLQKVPGWSQEEAQRAARAIVSLAQWLKLLNESIYAPHDLHRHITTILNTTDPQRRTVLIREQLEAILNDPKFRALLDDGLDRLEKQWPFIDAKLRSYGFDGRGLRSFIDLIAKSAREFNEAWSAAWLAE